MRRVRKRFMAGLVSLIMVIGLLPAFTLPVFAAYEDGMECENCGHYHWDSHCCGICGMCSSECDDDCYEETHCIECGDCKANGNIVCDCGYCFKCARELEPEKHCDYCGEEDDGAICMECGYCSECVNEFDAHCSVCEECVAGGLNMCEKTHPGGDTDPHCIGERDELVCSECDGCFFDNEDEFCSNCNKCLNCINSKGGHCCLCGACPSDEWPCDDVYEEAGENLVCETCCVSLGHHCSECYAHVTIESYEGVEAWCQTGGHGTHCASCAELTWCEGCDQCWECAGLEQCEECYLCEECCRANTESANCDHDYCVESDEYEEHLCPDCSNCPGDDPCEIETCGRCAACAASEHCEHDRCPHDPDWEYEHVCPDCGKCFWSDDLCEACGLCADDNEHCEDDVCPEDASAWDAHACPNCGDCPGQDDLCPTCGLCKTCADHCPHNKCKYAPDFGDGDSCDCTPCLHEHKGDSYEKNRQGHWKICLDCGLHVDRDTHTAGEPVLNAEASTADLDVFDIPCEVCGYHMVTYKCPKGEVPPHMHRYDMNGYCTVCGSKSDGKPYIIRQPEDYVGTMPKGGKEDGIKVRFSLQAYGSGTLSYQWYSANGSPLADGGAGGWVSGTTTPTLTVVIPEDACKEDYEFYCEVSNALGNVHSETVGLRIKHRYTANYWVPKLDIHGNEITINLYWASGGIEYGYPVSDCHILSCEGCGEAKPEAAPQCHSYGEWETKQEPSPGYRGIKTRKCRICGHNQYVTFENHECSYVVRNDDTHHWEECSTCAKKKPLKNVDLDKMGIDEATYKEAHYYGDFVRTVEPTEDEFGEEEARCVREGCTATVTRPVQKKPHKHEYFTMEEYYDILTKGLDQYRWENTTDGEGNPTGGTLYVTRGGNELQVFGANVSHHYFYCKKPGCNKKGPVRRHRMTSWIADLPPSATESGSAKSECLDCGFEIRKALKMGSYPIIVENGISLNMAGEAVAGGSVGDTIRIRAKQIPGKQFLRWDTISGGVTIAEPDQEESTFAVQTITPPAAGAPYTAYFIHVKATIGDCPHDGGRTTGPEIPAGCESYGKEGDTLCDICSEVLEEGLVTEPTGHAAEEFWVIDASSVTPGTCQLFGNTGNRICPWCNQIMAKGEKTPRVHANTTLSGVVAPTCAARGYSGDKMCDDCGKMAEKGHVVDKLPHSFGEWRIQKPATATEPGKEVRECTRCSAKEYRDFTPGVAVTGVTLNKNELALYVGRSETLLASVAPSDAANQNVSWTSSAPTIAAVDGNGNVTAKAEGTATITVTTEQGGFTATCTVSVTEAPPRALTGIRITTPPQKTAYTEGQSFDDTGMVVTADYNDNTEAAVVTYTYSPDGALTTADTQITVSYHEDGITMTAVQPITVQKASSGGGGGGGSAAARYTITVKAAENGKVTADRASAPKGATVALTVQPDEGYVLDVLTVRDGLGKKVGIAKEGNSKYTFTMPGSEATVEASFKAAVPGVKPPAETEKPPVATTSFTDIPAGAYYEAAVLWAVEKGIASGTTASTFDPNGVCTRAQAMTFLWRAAGSPAPKSNTMPFTDVPRDSYYYKAVLWAAENGIAKGVSATTFNPQGTCSRAQIVSFLWRTKGSPVVSGGSAFSDVASDAYYAVAVAWAEKNGITGGIGGGLFGPDNDCTRAQIVSFIYRSMK